VLGEDLGKGFGRDPGRDLGEASGERRGLQSRALPNCQHHIWLRGNRA
jgi:hypothetical protein